MDLRFDPQALRDAARAAETAISGGSPYRASEALVRLGCRYRDMGELQAAIASFEQALPWTRLVGNADASVDVLCMLAECAADLAEDLDDGDRLSGRGRPAREIGRTHAREAWALTARTTDAKVELKLLLRVGEVLTRFGDHDAAFALQKRTLDLMRGAPSRLDFVSTTFGDTC